MHIDTVLFFLCPVAYLIGVLVINSLMKLNVDQKYVSIRIIQSFDYPVGCVCREFIDLMCTNIILVTSQSRKSCAPPVISEPQVDPTGLDLCFCQTWSPQPDKFANINSKQT